MPRYKITIEYDGTAYAGWQRQPDVPTVQQSIEKAIATFSSEDIKIQGAGRTDAGVHAKGQVAHFDLEKDWEAFRVGEAINALLRPQPIAILDVQKVDAEFEARFSATQRHYLYRILNRRAPAGLEQKRVWPVHVPLDADAMHEAAQVFVGKHDFSTFRAAACQAKTPVKTLNAFSVSRVGDEVHLKICALSFLHNQVRAMTGSLKLVGEGKWNAADLEAALLSKDRARCGAQAPAAGLYLTRVDYPA